MSSERRDGQRLGCFFVSEDETMVQPAFERRKGTSDGQIVAEDDGYEVKTKMVKVG
jgi:hypothetical protein